MDEKTIIVKQGGGFGSFLRGLVIGAAIAFLVAPRSGEETRQMLTEKGVEFKDKAVDMAKDTRDRAQGIVSDARSKIEDTVKNVKEQTPDSTKELKRELEIEEEINNPNFNL
jgi:gas vesicle protein